MMPVRAAVGISPNGAEVWLILVFPLLLEKAAIDQVAVDIVGKTVMTRDLDCEYGFSLQTNQTVLRLAFC